MQQSVVFSVHDLKVYPLTAIGDDSTDPTYGTAVDVPGVSEISVETSVTEEMLRGDGKVLDHRSVLDSISFSFTYGKISPAVLAVIDGGTASQNAGGDTDRYIRNADDLVPSFGFAASVEEVDSPGGAAKIYGYRAKVNSGSLFPASDNAYAEPSFDATAIPLPIGAFFAIDLEDALAVLPADGTALIATYTDLA